MSRTGDAPRTGRRRQAVLVPGGTLLAVALLAVTAHPSRSEPAPPRAEGRPAVPQERDLPELPGSVDKRDNKRMKQKDFRKFVEAASKNLDLAVDDSNYRVVWHRGLRHGGIVPVGIYPERRSLYLKKEHLKDFKKKQGRVLAAIVNHGDDIETQWKIPAGGTAYWVLERVGDDLDDPASYRSFLVIDPGEEGKEKEEIVVVPAESDFEVCEHTEEEPKHTRPFGDFARKENCRSGKMKRMTFPSEPLDPKQVRAAVQNFQKANRSLPQSLRAARLLLELSVKPSVSMGDPWVACDVGCCTMTEQVALKK